MLRAIDRRFPWIPLDLQCIRQLSAHQCRIVLFPFIQLLYKAALIQLCNEAGIDEFFGLVIADIGASLGDVVVGRFQAFGDRIRRGDEILLENIVRAFEKLRVGGSYVLGQDFQAELFILLVKREAGRRV